MTAPLRRLAGLSRYRFHGAAGLVAAAYAHLRLAINVENPLATWQALYELSAPLPFGHRVLVPLLCRPLVGIGITVADAYLLVEWLSTLALIVLMRRLLKDHMAPTAAAAGAFGILLILPCTFLLQLEWPALYYPYDTPAMLLILLGLHLALQERWLALTACTALAAANRESALLIPMMAVAIQARRFNWAGCLRLGLQPALAFFAVRAGIAAMVVGNERPYGGYLAWVRDDRLRLLGNLDWLAGFGNQLTLLVTLGFLPLICLALYRHIPTALRPLLAIAGAYFCGLMFIGNPYEPRIFGEIIVMLYVPALLGLHHALSREAATAQGGSTPARNAT